MNLPLRPPQQGTPLASVDCKNLQSDVVLVAVVAEVVAVIVVVVVVVLTERIKGKINCIRKLST